MENKVADYTVSGDLELLKKEQVTFILLAAMISWPVTIPIWMNLSAGFQSGDAKAIELAFGSWPMLFGVGPMLSAILVTAWFRGKTGIFEIGKRVVIWRVNPKWFLIALTLPLISQWLGLWLWGYVTATTINYPELSGFIFSWLQIAVISSLYFITEELGWRGFLLPRMLTNHQWLSASLLLGVIWAVWHYPYWLLSSWAYTGSWLESANMAMASTCIAIALCVMLTWIFKNTRGSVLLAMIFHGSNNANFDKMFTAAGDDAIGLSFLLTHAFTASFIALLLVAVVIFGRGRNQKTRA